MKLRDGRFHRSLDGLVECQQENEYLKGVIKRLASMEAFTVAFAANIHSQEYKELRARMEYADGVEHKSESSGSVPMSELTKLLDVWEYRIGETNLRTDYDRGMEKGFQICADGLRRKMEQNDTDEARSKTKGEV